MLVPWVKLCVEEKLLVFPFPSWVSLVSKNYEIERTIVQLENEIYQIKQQHGEANKENIRQDFWRAEGRGAGSTKPSAAGFLRAAVWLGV